METKIATNENQSKKLIELGIDVNTADMMWTYDFVVNDINGLNVISDNFKPEENDIPAWSLSALIELMPSVTLDSSNDHYYRLRCMEKFTEWHKNIIDASFEMVCYLLENKMIK